MTGKLSNFVGVIWDSLCAFPEPHTRAREVETTCCAGVSITKSLERIEIPLVIYDSCDGLGLLSNFPGARPLQLSPPLSD